MTCSSSAVEIGLDDEPGAHAMRREALALRDLQPGLARAVAENLSDAVAGETGFDRASRGQPRKDRAIGDARALQPKFCRPHRTGCGLQTPRAMSTSAPCPYLKALLLKRHFGLWHR
jgi:hypothetical protein